MVVIEKLMVPLTQTRKVKLAPCGQISVAELVGEKDGVTVGLNHWAMVY